LGSACKLSTIDPNDSATPFKLYSGVKAKYCRIHPSQPQFNLGYKPDWLELGTLIIAKLGDDIYKQIRVADDTFEDNFDYYDGLLTITRWQVVAL